MSFPPSVFEKKTTTYDINYESRKGAKFRDAAKGIVPLRALCGFARKPAFAMSFPLFVF